MKRKVILVGALAAILSFVGCNILNVNSDLVFHCTFDDVQSVISPDIGPAGTTNGVRFVEGKCGKALYVPAHAAVAEFPFPNGLPTECGTIEFWAKLDGNKMTYGDGSDPYLFIVTKETKGWPVVFECNFNSNNGRGMSGFFCGMSFGRAVNVRGRGNRYASIVGEKDTFGWHKYTIIWNRAGLDAHGNILRVSIDDKVIGAGVNAKKDVDTFFAEIGGPVKLVFSNPNTGHGSSPVSIDDFKIWSTIREVDGLE